MPAACRPPVLLALLALLAASGSVHADGDAKRGQRLAYTCLGCHGIPNYKNTYPTFRVPKLEGQNVEYLVSALRAYQSKERSHATMHAHAVDMSEQDMRDVAAYLAGAPLKSDGKPEGTPPQAAQVCVACHGNDGVGIAPEYPVLAGQHADYLARTLLDYRNGGRRNAIMAGFVATLTDEDIEALAEYYAAQKPGLRTVKR